MRRPLLVGNGGDASRAWRFAGSVGLAAVLLLIGCPARGGAIYDGSLSLTITMPPAILNTFGFAGPLASFDNDSFEVGNALAISSMGTYTRFPAPPPVGGTVGNVGIGGVSNQATGFATSFSQGVIGANLANLTGAAPGTPPAQVVVVPFSYALNYSLSTLVDDPLYDFAEATVHFSVSLGGVVIDTVDETVQNNDPAVNRAINKVLMLSLPANSIRALRVDFYVTGVAVSTQPPAPVLPIPPFIPDPLPYPIPEPSSVVLGCIAMICLAWPGIKSWNRVRSD